MQLKHGYMMAVDTEKVEDVAESISPTTLDYLTGWRLHAVTFTYVHQDVCSLV
jgi:hypothetical protein